METAALERLGLTHGEAKVYLALLRLGPSTTGPITKAARVASSKTYELLDKLQEKGLVTTYLEGTVRHFCAVDPERLRDYLAERAEALRGVGRELDTLIPRLALVRGEHAETTVEAFKGRRGVATVFAELLRELRAGDEYLVIGGGDTPSANPQTTRFFEKVHRERARKGVVLRIIFNEARRGAMRKQTLFPLTRSRYLPFGTPSTINIYKDVTVLLTMSPEPAAIRIRNAQMTESYRRYFETMWARAKK